MMNDNFEYRSTCPACRSETYSLRYEATYTKPPLRDYLLDFYSQQRIDFELLTGASYSLGECNRCGLLFQREIPGPNLMQELYDQWIDQHKSFEKNKSKSVEDCRRQASEILALCLQLGKKPAEITVLDFGMGWGDWLLMAKASGFRAFGMELSQSRLENGRGVGDVTPFFRSASYESRLAASVSWQEDCEHHDQEKEAAFAGANRSENPGR